MGISAVSVPDCPFCRVNNLLKEQVVAETESAYLIPAHMSPGCYLIIPSVHAELLTELSDTWWREVKELLVHVPGLTESYNLSLNFGREAGQTIKHLHFWVIPRPAGQPASGKGLASFVSKANQE
jgi:diadenosine tetraphosphate (Ap4A) HIT family hydrolase